MIDITTKVIVFFFTGHPNRFLPVRSVRRSHRRTHLFCCHIRVVEKEQTQFFHNVCISTVDGNMQFYLYINKTNKLKLKLKVRIYIIYK